MTSQVALVIIDAQNEFLHPSGNFPADKLCRSLVIANLQHLIPRFREEGGDIIWACANYDNRTKEPPIMEAQNRGDGIVGSNEWLVAATHVFHIPCCELNSWGAEIHDDVKGFVEEKDAFIIKKGYSAFWQDNKFLEMLRARGIEELYFCGVASGTCVLATVCDALKLGGEFKINVVEDCMGYRRYNTHEEAMRRYKEFGVGIFKADEVDVKFSVLATAAPSPAQPQVFDSHLPVVGSTTSLQRLDSVASTPPEDACTDTCTGIELRRTGSFDFLEVKGFVEE